MGAWRVLYGRERGGRGRRGGACLGGSGPGGAVGGTGRPLGCWREATVAVRAVTYVERAVTSPSRRETCACRPTISRLPGVGVAIGLEPSVGWEAGGLLRLIDRAARRAGKGGAAGC